MAKQKPAPKPPEPPEIDIRRLHLWQIQPVRDLLVVASIIGVIYLGSVLSVLTVPMLLALTLAYLFDPVVRWLSRRLRVPRPIATAMIIAASVVVIAVPSIIGVTFAVLQGVSYAGRIGEQVTILRRVANEPKEERHIRALEEGGWRKLGEYIRDFELGPLVAPSAPGEAPQDPLPLPPVGPSAAANITGADPSAAPEDVPPATTPGPQIDATPNATPVEPVKPAAEPALEPAADSAASPKAEADPAALPVPAVDLDPLPGSAEPPVPPEAVEEEPDMGVREVFDRGRELFDQQVAWAINWARDNAGTIGRVMQPVVGTGADALTLVLQFFTSIAVISFQIFLTIFFFFFFSSRWGPVSESLINLVPTASRPRTLDVLSRMDTVVAAFIRGRLIISGIMSLLYIVAYWIIGVPAALVVGLLVGILSAIPYLPLIGVPISILLMFLMPVGEPKSFWYILLVPTLTYWVIQLTDDYIWTPLIQGKATDMDTPTILFAVLAGGILGGVYGVLLAIPVGACFKIVIKEVVMPRFREWAEGRAPDFLPIEERVHPVQTEPLPVAEPPPPQPLEGPPAPETRDGANVANQSAIGNTSDGSAKNQTASSSGPGPASAATSA